MQTILNLQRTATTATGAEPRFSTVSVVVCGSSLSLALC